MSPPCPPLVPPPFFYFAHQGSAEEAHQGVPEVSGHGLLRPALGVLNVVRLASASGGRAILLLDEPSVGGDRDGEDETDDVVARVPHRRDQVWKNQASIL